MKLLECHVDNFGKLSNYEYRFSESLTVIQEPNGFGKSTLAAFIKAMLYGFPRTAGRSVAGNERNIFRGRAEPMAEAWISSLTEPLTGCGGRLERPQRKIPLSFGI
mgnify:CR=1 FL=1